MAIKAKHQENTFFVGDTVKVQQKIIEGGKERIQYFEGVVMAIRGESTNKTFTVRRIGADKVGVERIWPLDSPWVLKIEVVRSGKPRRAKLYYLRGRVGSQALRVRLRAKGKTKVKAVPKKKPQSSKKAGKARKKPETRK